MSRIAMGIEYDGAGFCGWQVQQPGIQTVQGVLETALSRVANAPVRVHCAGRTDTGVHASHFIAHFDMPSTDSCDPSSDQFIFKLNRFLPPDIVVYKIFKVREDLHARFSATYRTYHYHISTYKPLFKREFCHYVYGELDLKAIHACCDLILDTSDFTSFAKLHSDVKTNICMVSHARWQEVDEGYRFEITADRFLRNMVRSITGTLLDVGLGNTDPKGFKEIVEARDRSKAGTSAPAKALFLVDIGYPV